SARQIPAPCPTQPDVSANEQGVSAFHDEFVGSRSPPVALCPGSLVQRQLSVAGARGGAVDLLDLRLLDRVYAPLGPRTRAGAAKPILWNREEFLTRLSRTPRRPKRPRLWAEDRAHKRGRLGRRKSRTAHKRYNERL